MELLEYDKLQQMVDYSFGDHSGVLGGVPNAYMKKANIYNREFVNKVQEFKRLGKKRMTLFIDNIRLYRRPLDYSDWTHTRPITPNDRQWLSQFRDEDLLELCSLFPALSYTIFTAFEDIPLDPYVWQNIPRNVRSINAANAVTFGKKIRPFPHGIERKMYAGYNHHEILKKMMNKEIEPTKLLFVAHREDTGNRTTLGTLFKDKPWATVTHLPYEQYLNEMKNHKFVLCPSGNGIESSRNWETLYMRRVPVFEDHRYKRAMFKGFPALFVKDYSEITEELLLNNNHLFIEAQNMDMNKLDLNYWFNNAI